MAAFGRCRASYLHLGFMVLFSSCIWAAEFSGGTGTPDDPYQIATAAQLVSIGSDPNLLDRHFVLLCDIDLGSYSTTHSTFTQAVIAPTVVHEEGREAWIEYLEFNGRFDGGGHGIGDLVIAGEAAPSCVGLFGTVGSRGRIQNLNVDGALVKGSSYTGGLVGSNEGTIWRCRVSGQVSGAQCVGGLAGRNQGTIAMSHASGVVSGKNQCSRLGGLVGQNFDAVIIDSYSNAAVQAGDYSDYLGALAGDNSAAIANCYATGCVSAGDGSTLVGGLVGENSGSIVNSYALGSVLSGESSDSVGGLVGSNPGSIANCYATGHVSAGTDSRNVGGFSGEAALTAGGASHCFWNVETAGVLRSGGGTALPTTKMQDADGYLKEGWDWMGERANGTADLWVIPEGGGYPKLTVFTDPCEGHVLQGTGTRDDPYQLASAEDIGALSRYDPSASYQLEADVDMSGIVWTSAPVAGFDGSFEGGGHAVSALTICDGGYLGLFGLLTSGSHITDVVVENAHVRGAGRTVRIGTLAGENMGSISGCRATGDVYGFHTVGGLVGSNLWGKVANCGAAVDIQGARFDCGGLAGLNTGGISACFATGNVSGVKGVQDIGGLVGYNNHLGHITDCYARGAVQAEEYSCHIGGLMGHNLGLVVNCYAVGGVAAKISSLGVGGLVGKNEGGTVQACYSLAGPIGAGLTSVGQSLNRDEMMSQSSFVDWDFDAVWAICEGQDYPRLRWEGASCE